MTIAVDMGRKATKTNKQNIDVLLLTSDSCKAAVSYCQRYGYTKYWSQGYKTFFMLNSAEHEIYPAHKC